MYSEEESIDGIEFFPNGSLEDYLMSLAVDAEAEEDIGYPCTICIGLGQKRPKISSLKLPKGAFLAGVCMMIIYSYGCILIN